MGGREERGKREKGKKVGYTENHRGREPTPRGATEKVLNFSLNK